MSLSSACTLFNLGPLEGCPTAHLGPIHLDIPLTIQDCWLPTARLPVFLIASNHFCLPA